MTAISEDDRKAAREEVLKCSRCKHEMEYPDDAEGCEDFDCPMHEMTNDLPPYDGEGRGFAEQTRVDAEADAATTAQTPTAICEICGDPMPAGEEVFKFHGLSGPCPKPPLPVSIGVTPSRRTARALVYKLQAQLDEANARIAALLSTRRAVPSETNVERAARLWEQLGCIADDNKCLALLAAEFEAVAAQTPQVEQ